jgi:WD40 repeat protein
LFTGSWDKIVRAIDLKTGEIDRSFVASREAINCLHLWDKWLFVSGIDPVIRAYDLTTGAVKTFEGHRSWVLSMTTNITLKEDGSIKNQWLYSASDEGTIRIWDILTTKCLENLEGHKNGVTQMAFCNNQLHTSSYDHYVIVWDL